MQTNADPKEYLHAIHGLDFPASRIQIVNAAKDTGGTNGEVIIVLEHLPERIYATAEDLTDEIQRTHEATSSGSDVQPAAASGMSDANKGLVGTVADPRRANTPDEGEKAQAQRILARNRKLMDHTVEAGPAGEIATGVGHMINSDRSHAGGDYSND